MLEFTINDSVLFDPPINMCAGCFLLEPNAHIFTDFYNYIYFYHFKEFWYAAVLVCLNEAITQFNVLASL